MQKQYGFTTVELLIVIVVIAVLAAITVVAFNGVSKRAQFSSMKSDINAIKKQLELYKVDNGSYPDSSLCVSDHGDTNYQYYWCGWNQGRDDSFIPGLSAYGTVPNLDTKRASNDTYLYQTRSASGAIPGVDQYQLIRYNAAGLDASEKDGSMELLTGNGYDGIAWGIRSNAATGWW
jgi:prepilin-type N-terminal cleavage/methylation domain-containing protein